MTNEFYHRRTWTRPKKDHKYTRREWKNSHWVYYYDDGTTTKDYPKGQNYKTIDQVTAEKSAEKAAMKERQAKAKKQQETAEKIDNVFDAWVDKGKSAVEKVFRVLDSRPSDLFRERRPDE